MGPVRRNSRLQLVCSRQKPQKNITSHHSDHMLAGHDKPIQLKTCKLIDTTSMLRNWIQVQEDSNATIRISIARMYTRRDRPWLSNTYADIGLASAPAYAAD